MEQNQCITYIPQRGRTNKQSNESSEQEERTYWEKKATSGQEPGEQAKSREGEGDVDARQALHMIHLRLRQDVGSTEFKTKSLFSPRQIAAKKEGGGSEVQGEPS